MSLVAVQLFWLERDENPGFEAVCDVFSGFGSSAGEALDNLAAAIEAGPPKPDPLSSPVALVEAAASAGPGIDYDKLAAAIVQKMNTDAAASGETVTLTPATPAPAPVQEPVPVVPAPIIVPAEQPTGPAAS